MRGTGFLLEAILLVRIEVAVGAQSVDAPMVRVRLVLRCGRVCHMTVPGH